MTRPRWRLLLFQLVSGVSVGSPPVSSEADAPGKLPAGAKPLHHGSRKCCCCLTLVPRQEAQDDRTAPGGGRGRCQSCRGRSPTSQVRQWEAQSEQLAVLIVDPAGLCSLTPHRPQVFATLRPRDGRDRLGQAQGLHQG